MVSVLGILPSFSACGAERGRPSITFLCVQVSSRRQLCGLLSGGTRPAPFTPPLKQNDLFACLLARRVGPSATPSVRVWSCVRRSGGSFVILPLSLSLSLSGSSFMFPCMCMLGWMRGPKLAVILSWPCFRLSDIAHPTYVQPACLEGKIQNACLFTKKNAVAGRPTPCAANTCNRTSLASSAKTQKSAA